MNGFFQTAQGLFFFFFLFYHFHPGKTWTFLKRAVVWMEAEASSPLSCRTSPAFFTPSMRSLTPPSTILQAAARPCGSSSPWPPTPASGGGAVRRLLQVERARGWVGVLGEGVLVFFLLRGGWPSVDACCHRRACRRAERQQLQARHSFVHRSLCVVHHSHSMGIIFNDGGSDRAKRAHPTPHKPFKYSKKP